MKTKHEGALSGIWAVTWRSFVYPGVFVFLLCFVIAMLFLPIVGAIWLFYGLWWQGMAFFIVWVSAIWIWRHCRPSRFFESPPYWV